MEKFLAIGDIHGCAKQLLELLEKTKKYPEHKLIFLGDYIDRGPEPDKVLSILQEQDAICLQGNHENMLIEEVQTAPEVIDELLKISRISKKNFEWISTLPFIYETENYIFTHAGLHPTKALDMQRAEDYIWSFFEGSYKHLTKKTVVQGHLHKSELYVFENHIITDTNCGLGGYLTGVLLPEIVPIRSETRSPMPKHF